ncbi:transglycosylase SLT domain-containing protein [Vibrio sp. TBV020]|uniref:transglycosylase SLT domain-containing protein n=1 Tax=Vibrio sp. TBV020 TaxID=3137398 RepID=UPI0038CD10E6
MIRFTLIAILSVFSSVGLALELSPLSSQPYVGDFSELKKRGVIRVLVSADLGFYYIEGGKPKGIVAEMLYHFEKNVKQKHPSVNVQVIPVPRDDLLQSLKVGYGDIAVANLTITERRKQIIDFSDPVIKDAQEWIITNKSHQSFTSIEDLSGQEIWVRGSSSYFESLQKVNQHLDSLEMPPIHINFIEETLQDYELIEMVNKGFINATVLDSHKAKMWQGVMENIQLHRDLPIRKGSQIAWAIRKESPNLKKVVNRYVGKAKSGTLLGNVIYRRYIDNTRWLSRSLDDSQLKQLANLSHIFEHYSDIYGFDPLMVSAQGYQESGLDQRKVSHRGAVGVMQVLPSTAKDRNVNVKNIHKVDNNIHAGVKYLNFIHKRYFDDESISPDDQIYFSLAAYNAGPAKIRKIRKLAAKYGYDPNKWFKNVEIVARKHISREPVQYVTNINRYYVIYKQLARVNLANNGNAKLHELHLIDR